MSTLYNPDLLQELEGELSSLKEEILSPVGGQPDMELEADTCSSVLGLTGKLGKLPCKVFDGLPNTLESDPRYVIPQTVLGEFVAMQQMLLVQGRTAPVLLIGPSGSGKTKFAEEYAARTGRAFVRVSCNAKMDWDLYVGSRQLIGGETPFEAGPFLESFEYPTVYNLDEPSSMPTGLMLGVGQRLYEKGELYVPELKKTMRMHPDSVMILTDNSIGLGDNIDKYISRNVVDVSTLNRIAGYINVPYMSEADTALLIKRYIPGFGSDNTEKLAGLTCTLAYAFESGELPLPFSPGRTAVNIAQLSMVINSIRHAFELCYLNALDGEAKGVANNLFVAKFGK